MAEMSGLMSVSCDNGSSQEKHVTIFKKDSFPGEEEIKKRRLGAVRNRLFMTLYIIGC